jgi:hypothetical protein
VTRQGNVLVAQETKSDFGGDSVSTRRFGFERTSAKLIYATRITSYSGGFVKHSDLLQKVITVNYIALKKPFQEVVLDCVVLLPGVDSGN